MSGGESNYIRTFHARKQELNLVRLWWQWLMFIVKRIDLLQWPNFVQQDRDYIGFATLPEQVHRKSVKRGFEFTLMVVGETGLGKSTLINSLFLGDLYKDRRIPDALERVEKTTSVEKKTMDIEERGVRLRLTIVDTPGKVPVTHLCRSILVLVPSRYRYGTAVRVHCVLYSIRYLSARHLVA